MTSSNLSIVEGIHKFEEEQEKRLEKARAANEAKLEAIYKSREVQLHRAEEESLKEKEKKVREATEQAKKEVAATLREYTTLIDELKQKSSKNSEKAAEKCYSVLLEE